jgi:hypothetical protein
MPADPEFTNRLKDATQLYNDNDLETCEVLTRDLLADSGIPRYHKMKALLLLASFVEDAEEANECVCEKWKACGGW